MEDKSTNRINQRMALLTDNDTKFRQSVRLLRNEIGMPEDGFKSEAEYIEWARNGHNSEKFAQAQYALLADYKLSSRYLEPILWFFGFDWHMPVSAMKYSIHYDKTNQRLSIEIYGDTTEDDLKKAYREIEKRKVRQSLPEYADRFKPIIGIDLMRNVYELQKKGKSNSDIAKIITDDPNYKKGLSYEDIRKKIAKYGIISPKTQSRRGKKPER